ncbi:MAG: glycoside hydrolase [Lachnospiraceae bacterium]|nr:glycoside hydrolase [Lachnospiraceae bacterium]
MRRAKRFLALALAVSIAFPAGQTAFAATTSNEVSEREKQNAALAREAGAESMVLLENNGVLPVSSKKLALFGGGAVRTVRGGTGSGDPFNGGLSGGGDAAVNQSERYNINILTSFEKAKYEITTADILKEYAKGYDEAYVEAAGNPMSTFVYPELEFTDEQLKKAKEGTDTAIYVISRNAGEGADRNMKTETTVTGDDGQAVTFEIGDYELTDVEKDNLRRVSAAFENTIVVLNVGGVIDTKFFNEIKGLDALLLMGQAGQEGGNALMDVISGTVNPSGKLVATWARDYKDYPAAGKFAGQDGDSMNEFYEEGIYVGYRYFDTFGIKPAYEFGYGQSYTDFDIEVTEVKADANKVTVKAVVTNTGSTYSGREVVQVYFSAPDSKEAEKEYQQLAAYGKTDELKPGQCQTLELSYDVSEMAYYNEAKAAYILDEGTYYVRVGNSSRNTRVVGALKVNGTKAVEQLSNQMEVPKDRELNEWSKAGNSPYSYKKEKSEMAEADKKAIVIDSSAITTKNSKSPYEDEKVTTYTTDKNYKAIQAYETVEYVEEKDVTLLDVYNKKATMEELVAQMSLEELSKLNCGSGWGVANESNPIVGANSSTVPGAAGETVAYEKYKIPSIVSADGPGGIRVKQKYEATIEGTDKKETYYQYATAWPVHYVLAQSWDTELLERVGKAFSVECAELHITTLLGPSLNIHRDPLCGRNFEYFGEDPTVAGTMASAITKGIQSEPGVGACLKHYAANSQETDRSGTDSVISERALREIYLKGFEIAVKESHPTSIMTSYNQINGVPTADSYDLCTNLARGEWGFNGLIMTDWNGGVSHASQSMHAGNDLIMPGGSSKASEIMLGAMDVAPVFDENGQIGLKDALMFMFTYQEAAWNDFEVKADGKETVIATLGGSHKATVDGKNVLVDGKQIFLEYQANIWWPGGEYKNPVTTDVAEVSADGKSITYKGNYKENNNICLGDVQKSAINNLNIIMRSNDMARIYETKNMPYTEEFSEGLKEYQTVTKTGVTEFKDKLDEAQEEVKDLQTQLTEAKTELSEAKKQHDTNVKNLTAEVDKLKKELEAAKAEVKKLKASANKKTVIKPKKSSYSVKKGKKVTIKVTVTNAKGKKVTYKSANRKIATVTNKGVVKGIKKGKTTITVKCNGVSKKVKVTVK